MLSISFFLLSLHSRLSLFHDFVVVDIALGYSSNSCCLLHGAKNHDYAQISLCAYLVTPYIPIAKARGFTAYLIKAVNPNDKFSQELYRVLLESSMFYGQGVTMQQLQELTGKSRNTIQSRLKTIPDGHLIVRKGSKYFYKLNLLMLRDER